MERIGRYRTERVLGTGAFGTVWLAHDETLQADVAIKVLAENWARDESFRRRFIDEARILWRADSDHLVRVHTVDELPDGRPYFVMDYADRGSLEERMRDRFTSGSWYRVEEAMAISREIADGLRVVHALGIAHRDLKPANVMFRSVPEHAGGEADERLVLVDFGVARALTANAATTIATGTPHYMAPEQADGRADRRSDVYSAAVIMYELLGRAVPYPYESLGQIIRAQTRGEFARLPTVRGDVSPALDAVVARGLSVDPEQRYEDAGAWINALQAAASAPEPPAAAPPAPDAGATMAPEDLRAARAAAVGAAAASVAGGPPSGPPSGGGGGGGGHGGGAGGGPPTGPPTGQGGHRRRRTSLVVTLLVLLALVGGGIAVIAMTGDDEADGPTAREVFAEPIASLGQDPFTDATPPDDTVQNTDSRLAGLIPRIGELPQVTLPPLPLPTTPATGATAAVPALAGSTPGLYGGTNLLSVCDAQKLVDFLKANADKARAWADTLDIGVDEIESYVAGLTDLILRADTRVTNHGFASGVAKPINAILQAGTAVLVDRFGVPVVRCKCGNPLKPAEPLASDASVRGTPWPGFSLPNTVTITQVNPVNEFTIGDVVTGEPLYRVPGTPATAATAQPTVTPDSTTTSPPTTAPPTTAPAATDVTQSGTVSASSEYPGGEFPATLATDGNDTTSWFSAGSQVDGDTTTFTWQAPGPIRIDRIEIISNANHPEFPTGFGFDAVSVEILDAGGQNVYIGGQELPGTPDPNVVLTPGVVGQTIRLGFGGHEAPDCGGFAELRVSGAPG